MTKRREFTKNVKAEIIRRAKDAKGQVRCESCRVAAVRFHIDHTIPDALQVDKSKPLTAADGKLLCAGSRESCHGRKTAEHDQPTIAKAKRNEAKHLGIKGAPSSLSRTRAEILAVKDARSRDRSGGKLPVPGPRALFGGGI